MATYLNNALADSMLPDGVGLRPPRTISPAQAGEILTQGFVHSGNPGHGNTWHAAAKLCGMPEIGEAKGGRVTLAAGDVLLVAGIRGLPRETREFSDEEIAQATIVFRYFEAYAG